MPSSPPTRRSPLHPAALLGLALLAPPLAAGEITAVTEAATGAPVAPNLSPLDEGVSYGISFEQSAGDPVLRGVYVPLPAGLGPVTVTETGGGGDVEVDLSALGATWSVSGDGEHVNVVDSGPGVPAGAFTITFAEVPAGAQLGWTHALFSDDGAPMPGANVLPSAPGDELRVPALVTARSFNRLQLDNEGDVLVHLSNPSVGSDPGAGDFSGDLYTKVFPKEALRHPKGTMTVTAVEYVVFDQDWDLDDATLWSWGLTVGVDSADTGNGGSGANPGNVEPDFDDPLAVFLPEVPSVGLGNPSGAGQCPPVGEIAGYTVVETLLDTTGQPIPILSMVADGATDYVFTHFAPGGQEMFDGGVSCGPGNATLSYHLSTDYMNFPFAPFEGENAPDVLGSGYSPHGAHRAGGEPDFVPHGLDETAAVRLFFEEPVLGPRVDAGLDDGLIELGLAGLNLPIGVDSGGVSTGTSAKLGWRIYNDDAAPAVPGPNAARVATVFATLGAPLPAPGIGVNGACLLLNPVDPLFADSTTAWGLNFFQGFDSDGDLDVDETYFQANLVPVAPAPALVDVALYAQGIDLATVSLAAQSTQVVEVRLRAND